jgi:hypothetical protein
MHETMRSHPKASPPSPRLVLPRPVPRHETEIDTAPDPGSDPARGPGHRLREIHAAAQERGPATAADALVAPEMDYRVVLRCTAADLDH